MNPHIRLRIDLQDSLLHDLCLITAHGLSRRNNLTVQVRQAHLIVIHQVKSLHAAPRQRLTYISSDAPHTEHGDTGRIQLIHGFLANQQLCS